MDWFSVLGSNASILGAIFAFLAFLKARKIQENLQAEKERQKKKVVITLQHGSNKIELPVTIRRLELTRAEILGRIGMIPVKNRDESNSRFGIKYINDPDFFKQIERILDSDGDELLVISLTEEEYNHFDVK